MDVGGKPDAEYLERSHLSSEWSGKRGSLLRTQPQSHKLVAVDLGSCYRLIPGDFLVSVAYFGHTFNESRHKRDTGPNFSYLGR